MSYSYQADLMTGFRLENISEDALETLLCRFIERHPNVFNSYPKDVYCETEAENVVQYWREYGFLISSGDDLFLGQVHAEFLEGADEFYEVDTTDFSAIPPEIVKFINECFPYTKEGLYIVPHYT